MVNLTPAVSYLKYTLVSKHKNGHGIHSPFLFEMINKVFQDKKNYPQYAKLESYFNELKEVERKIEIKEMGAGSKVFKDNTRRIGDLVRFAGVPAKYGRLLFRLIAYIKPEKVLELGSSLGVSGLYMALANSRTQIISIEGDPNLTMLSNQNAQNLYAENIQFINSDFDDYFQGNATNESFQFAFLDGDHSYESTMRYFTKVDQLCKEGVIVLDDINWSPGMQKAWREICENSPKHICVDVYRFGIILKREGVTPGRFVVRF